MMENPRVRMEHFPYAMTSKLRGYRVVDVP